MVILKDYDFLWDLVKENQASKISKFQKDGLCFANKRVNPDFVFVFHFDNNYIWGTYAYINKSKLKEYYKFISSLEKIIFSFNKPVLRMGKNQDFKNHSKYVGMIDNIPIYQYLGVNKNGWK